MQGRSTRLVSVAGQCRLRVGTALLTHIASLCETSLTVTTARQVSIVFTCKKDGARPIARKCWGFAAKHHKFQNVNKFVVLLFFYFFVRHNAPMDVSVLQNYRDDIRTHVEECQRAGKVNPCRTHASTSYRRVPGRNRGNSGHGDSAVPPPYEHRLLKGVSLRLYFSFC